MNIDINISKVHLILSLFVLISGAFYGFDKWIDKKISSHLQVGANHELIKDNQEEILEVKDYILHLEDRNDRRAERMEDRINAIRNP